VTFILTTNRPDLLERALVERPGRVDLAVHIDKPVTASFTKEAVRRCVLAAAQQDREPRDEDLERALDEMLSDAETFTRTLLGGGDLTLSMPPEEDEELVP
jgi:ATP-dependent 26S proteasome regulatory subunit